MDVLNKWGEEMSRLIDADALKEKYTMVTKRYSGGIMECPAVLLESIDSAPTIDAVRAKRGTWEKDDDGEFICSNCNNGYKDQPTLLGRPMFEYCPICGAKMGVEDHETD